MPFVLECSGLRKAFNSRLAVDGVSFHVAEGETYGLLGPNGAGKTTSIAMVVGLLKRDAGSVTIDGISLDRDPLGARARIGYVPQDLAIYPDLSARENLDFFGRLQGLRGAELRQRVDEALELVGLTDRAKERTAGYSGGMKRRLNIAVGLLNRPRLLILDEPTVGVDPQSRSAIIDSIEELQRGGMGVLYTTHYMEEAERLCRRVGIIDQGRLIAEGTAAELVEQIGEHDRVTLRATGDLEAARAALSAGPGVLSSSCSDSTVELVVAQSDRHLAAIIQSAIAAGARVQAVEVARPNLESVFLHLTGRALRD
jgi:ABC-2 type transport system ATP-binding protein